ncbi:hypothetical protein MCGE09_00490 [Thaumarchaeota archaeon SCGC AB-539-E09]|nr:hypothetical protein MCGE09_00490 [Thaumarchaeota archaeon SCGC AB-539-E09]
MLEDSHSYPNQTLHSLIENCITHWRENNYEQTDEKVKKNRKQLAQYIRKFHSDANTMTSNIQDKISVLETGSPILIMTAHQPNLFPYSGVVRKACLIFLLQCELEKRLKVPVISYFGIADQDFSDDRWIRTSLLPDISRKNGVLVLSLDLPNKIALNNEKKPDIRIINGWKIDIEQWLETNFLKIRSFCSENKINNLLKKEELAKDKFDQIWSVVVESYERASNYADFNAFFLSTLVNESWGYDVLFSRFSESQNVFTHEYNYLLANLKRYQNSLKKTSVFACVGDKESEYLPFWINCKCGSKSRVTPIVKEGILFGYSKCLRCSESEYVNLGKIEKPDVSQIISNLSARAIPMLLLHANGLDLTCYIGGIGGTDYLTRTKQVAKDLDIKLAPISIWRPYDRYVGIGQLSGLIELNRIRRKTNNIRTKNVIDVVEAKICSIYDDIKILENYKSELLKGYRKGEIKKSIFKKRLNKTIYEIKTIKREKNLYELSHDLKILKNVPKVINLIPSIIDYAINIGLKNTNDQWHNFLINNGSLTSEVLMKSILNDMDEIVNFYKEELNVINI